MLRSCNPGNTLSGLPATSTQRRRMCCGKHPCGSGGTLQRPIPASTVSYFASVLEQFIATLPGCVWTTMGQHCSKVRCATLCSVSFVCSFSVWARLETTIRCKCRVATATFCHHAASSHTCIEKVPPAQDLAQPSGLEGATVSAPFPSPPSGLPPRLSPPRIYTCPFSSSWPLSIRPAMFFWSHALITSLTTVLTWCSLPGPPLVVGSGLGCDLPIIEAGRM